MLDNIIVNDINLNYKVSGNGNPVVILHGWGTNLTTMNIIGEFLEKDFKVYSFDLPGFGQTDEPPHPWGIYEYANFVEAALRQLEVESPILIGHSFGGRISIILSSRIKVNKLILVDSAGIKPKRKFKYYLNIYTYKFIRVMSKLPILNYLFAQFIEDYRKTAGSADYASSSDIMKGVLSKVVNQDLRKHFSSIKCKTLLMWGENDMDTPVADGEIMNSGIKDSELVVLKGAGHFSFLDKSQEFLIIMNHFLKEN